jgi:DNA replication protein DnaC
MKPIDMSRIVSVADAVQPCIAGLEKIAKETTEFFGQMRERLAQVDPESCVDHGTVLEIDEEETMRASWNTKTLNVRYKQCPKCQADFSKVLVNEKHRKMGIPEMVIDATVDNFLTDSDTKKKAIIKVRRQLMNGAGFLILRGEPGTGKSHLAAAALKEKGGIFITEADLIGELRQTYTDNLGQDDMVEKYRTAKILVLDELTTDVVGKDIPALLYRILADRYDKGRLTIITSNETLETIVTILGPRLTDRMKSNYTIVTCEWESFRKPKK